MLYMSSSTGLLVEQTGLLDMLVETSHKLLFPLPLTKMSLVATMLKPGRLWLRLGSPNHWPQFWLEGRRHA